MQTFYLHVPFDIAVNFQVQNTIVLFESYKKIFEISISFALHMYCRIKNIKIFKYALCKVIRDLLLKIKYIDCDIEKNVVFVVFYPA